MANDDERKCMGQLKRKGSAHGPWLASRPKAVCHLSICVMLDVTYASEQACQGD